MMMQQIYCFQRTQKHQERRMKGLTEHSVHIWRRKNIKMWILQTEAINGFTFLSELRMSSRHIIKTNMVLWFCAISIYNALWKMILHEALVLYECMLCIYVRMFVCVNVCICVCMYVCMHVCTMTIPAREREREKFCVRHRSRFDWLVTLKYHTLV